ncbi:MAG: hypothetical protein ACREOZ_01885 [Gloeomargaritales cyanobacterium]
MASAATTAHLTGFNLQQTVSYYTELQALENEVNRSGNRTGNVNERQSSSANRSGRNRNGSNSFNNYSSGRGNDNRANQANSNNNSRQRNTTNGRGHQASSSQGKWCHVHETSNHDLS